MELITLLLIIIALPVMFGILCWAAYFILSMICLAIMSLMSLNNSLFHKDRLQ